MPYLKTVLDNNLSRCFGTHFIEKNVNVFVNYKNHLYYKTVLHITLRNFSKLSFSKFLSVNFITFRVMVMFYFVLFEKKRSINRSLKKKVFYKMKCN